MCIRDRYEGLEKIGICGNDAVLVTGLGPVGLAALMLAKAMGAQKLIGVDTVAERCQIAKDLGLADEVFVSGPDVMEKVMAATNGRGFERTVDCSGHTSGRQLCIRAVSYTHLDVYKRQLITLSDRFTT